MSEHVRGITDCRGCGRRQPEDILEVRNWWMNLPAAGAVAEAPWAMFPDCAAKHGLGESNRRPRLRLIEGGKQ